MHFFKKGLGNPVISKIISEFAKKSACCAFVIGFPDPPTLGMSTGGHTGPSGFAELLFLVSNTLLVLFCTYPPFLDIHLIGDME